MRQISRNMEMIRPTIGWRRDEQGTHKHAHGSWILWSVSRVRSKTIHSLSCITSWLPNITLCYIDSRFFVPLEQSRTALLGCLLAASRLREAARWQLALYAGVKLYPQSLCIALWHAYNRRYKTGKERFHAMIQVDISSFDQSTLSFPFLFSFFSITRKDLITEVVIFLHLSCTFYIQFISFKIR